MTATSAHAQARLPFTQPLAERRRRLAEGTLTAQQYRRDLVDYVCETDPQVMAFADWRPADVTRSQVPWVPSVTYKDTIDVLGYPTRLGIRAGYRHYPQRSAKIARLLASRGLACVGKVATTECSVGSVKPSSNPVFPHVSAAGSSTGSAAAVAAGFCDVSVGTDSGGSLRWPAVYCGTTALRLTPAPGLLAGVHAVAPSMESVGLVTRTAADLSWLWRTYRLGALLGMDASSVPTRLRFAVITPPREALHPEVLATLAAAGDALASLGHAPINADLTGIWDQRQVAWELLSYEACRSYAWLFGRPGADLHRDTLLVFERGRRIADTRYSAALRAQQQARVRLTTLLTTTCDVLLMPLEHGLPDPAGRPPTATVPAPARTTPAGTALAGTADGGADDQRGLNAAGALTMIASFARLPVLALPLRLSSQRSPLGVQILAAPAAERLLVEVGELLSSLVGPLEANPAIADPPPPTPPNGWMPYD